MTNTLRVGIGFWVGKKIVGYFSSQAVRHFDYINFGSTLYSGSGKGVKIMARSGGRTMKPTKAKHASTHKQLNKTIVEDCFDIFSQQRKIKMIGSHINHLGQFRSGLYDRR